MIFQSFSRTASPSLAAVLVLAILGPASAESGDGASVIPPDAFSFATAEAEGTEGADVTGAVLPLPVKATAPAQVPERQELLATPPVRVPPAPTDRVRAMALQPLIARHAKEQGVPYALADAVVRIESRYNVAARNGPHLGLTQVSFNTAKSLGYSGPALGLLDADTNLRYGIRYLGQAYKLAGGDTCGAILRYQAGHRAQSMTNAARIYCAKVKTIIATAE